MSRMSRFVLSFLTLFSLHTLVSGEEGIHSFRSFSDEGWLVESRSTGHPQVLEFIDNLVIKHRELSRERLIGLFDRVNLEDPLKKRLSNQLRRPAEKTKSWESYRKQFINQKRVNDGIKFYRQHRELLENVSEAFSLPASIMLATLGVESRYGKAKYRYPVLNSLVINGFLNNYRSKFYLTQLEYFLLWAHRGGYSDDKIYAIRGSYSGAMGPAQFIPRSVHHFGHDFNRDGKVDMLNNYEDILGSIANYYSKNGWKKGKKVITDLPLPCKTGKDILTLTDEQDQERCWKKEHNYWAIFSYNHNDHYVQVIYLLAMLLDSKIDKLNNTDNELE